MRTRFYNPQPYDESGDTTLFRTLEWHQENVIPLIQQNLTSRKSVLDLGCGNGRYNKLTHGIFENILCVDPIETMDEKFTFSNTKFERTHLHELQGKFDNILMIGPMCAIWKKYGEDTMRYLHSLLNKNGLVFMEIDEASPCSFKRWNARGQSPVFHPVFEYRPPDGCSGRYKPVIKSEGYHFTAKQYDLYRTTLVVWESK
jgi:SAM-dependent methyltransferase